MSQSNIKPISINPDLFLLKKNKTNKIKKKKEINAKKLKMDLINRIKSLKKEKIKNDNLLFNDNKEYNDNNVKNENNNNVKNENKKRVNKNEENKNEENKNVENGKIIPKNSLQQKVYKEENIPLVIKDEFLESVNFLKNLGNNKTMKKDKKILEINEELDSKLLLNNDNKDNIEPNLEKLEDEKKSDNIFLKTTPDYGCLKNGEKPTYRTWKNTTLKKSNIEKNIPDLCSSISNNFKKSNFQNNDFENASLVNIDLDINNIPIMEGNKNLIGYNSEIGNNPSSNLRNHKTLKYILGKNKNKRKVSVLIKNNKTKKSIIAEHNSLKEESIHNIKKYLKSHNLLKSGSIAPSNIIKKIYEQAMLSGSVNNITNGSNLIENLIS